MSATHTQKTFETITVNASDLPVHCPGPNSPLWSMHPRVYIEIEKNGTASCPYCSATYQLAAHNNAE
ncbi:zinc-finger domain-containing protein [Paenalcaligenes faecalis]|uniref:zinc-finger domain-containing protein n=1 Tax=Paenalcaligenes faecalis TaxID=2980099 RepID=UPI0022B966AB|nr:zinc-finger domain-containing protein [Paenalcaligenes faecalis]